MTEGEANPRRHGMYSRAFARAEAEAQAPPPVPMPQVQARPLPEPPIAEAPHAVPRPVPPPAHARPRRRRRRPQLAANPRIASRPLGLRGVLTLATVLAVGGLLAPLALSGGDDRGSAMADVVAQEIAPVAYIEQPKGESRAPEAVSPAPRAESSTPRAESPAPRSGSATPRAQSPARVDGGLVVESRPAGARVTVNGIGYGETPLRIGYLPFGTKRIRLIKEGYTSVERTVRIDAGSPRPRVQVTLRQP